MQPFLSYLVFLALLAGFVLFICHSKFFKDKIIKKATILLAFAVKILAGGILVLIYSHFYHNRKSIDIFKYFDDAKIYKEILIRHPEAGLKMFFERNEYRNKSFVQNYYDKMQNWNYTNGNFFSKHNMIKINALLLIVSGGLYYTNALIFIIVSFLGLWLIFCSIKQFFEGKEKWLFVLLFFFPALLIWTSGILKESLMMLALGLCLYAFFKATNKKKLISVAVASAVLFLLFKPYLLVFLLICLPFAFYHKLKRNVFVGILIFYALAFVALIVSGWLLPIIIGRRAVFISAAQAANAGSLILPPQLNNSFLSFIYNLLFTLKISFFYPLILQFRGTLKLIPALGNIFLIGFLFVSFFFIRKFSPKQKSFLFFSIAFILMNYISVGMVCPIVGTVVRYKIFGELFFLVLPLLLIKSRSKRLKK